MRPFREMKIHSLGTDKVERAESTAGESTGDDYLVLDLSSGRYHQIGEVGGFIWERLDGEVDLGTIAALVAETFEVEPHQARRDLLLFVDSVVALGLAGRT